MKIADINILFTQLLHTFVPHKWQKHFLVSNGNINLRFKLKNVKVYMLTTCVPRPEGKTLCSLAEAQISINAYKHSHAAENALCFQVRKTGWCRNLKSQGLPPHFLQIQQPVQINGCCARKNVACGTHTSLNLHKA